MKKITALKLQTLIVGLLFLSYLSIGHARPGPALSADSELDYFIDYFSKDEFVLATEIFGELEFSGITDTRLYNIVEKQFLKFSAVKSYENSDITAWLSKALAYSGQEKYLATLKQVLKESPNRTLSNFKRHLNTSIERLPQHAIWNQEIVKNTDGLKGDELYRQRTYNMINASDSHLSMLGARRVWFHFPTDPLYVKAVSEKLAADYNRDNLSRRDIDAIGWFCNVLGKSEDKSYTEQLNTIVELSDNRRIRNYAKKNIRILNTEKRTGSNSPNQRNRRR